MIPSSNLDDRTFDDIVKEAIRLIPRYCPEWTNHNAADPGMALIELFAWMTEMTLFRLNRVPEKVYLSLLELLGLSLTPPQSARSVVQFFPIDGCRKAALIPRGTQIAAAAGGAEMDSSAELIFETEKSVTITANRLQSCAARVNENWHEYITGDDYDIFEPCPLFNSSDHVDHYLYLASDNFKYLAGEHIIEIAVTASHQIASVQDELINFLSFEYWDGRLWTSIEPARSAALHHKQDNVLYLKGIAPIEPCEVNGIEHYYIRAALTHIPENKKALTIAGIHTRTYLGSNGFIPGTCLCFNGAVYMECDMNTEFRLYSETPAYNEVFYLAADTVFSQIDAKVEINFMFSESYTQDMANENALFSYECWDGDTWRRIGSGPSVGEASREHNFSDGTLGFRHSGTVAFRMPSFIKKTAVNKQEHFWIRIRLATKDFAIGGEYSQDDRGEWHWRFNSKVHSPLIGKIRIRYDAGEQPLERVCAYSNFAWADFTKQLCSPPASKGDSEDTDEKEPAPDITIFNVEQDSLPSLFLGFAERFPRGEMSLYIKVAESAGKESAPRSAETALRGIFPDEARRKRRLDLRWSYWDGAGWKALPVNDYTDLFHESGFVEFMPPDNMKKLDTFSKELYWLRVSHAAGSFEKKPVIEAILMNAAYARHAHRYEGEAAGSGTGGPDQAVTLKHGPLLPGISIVVNEGTKPSENELEKMRQDGIAEPVIEEGGVYWVQYREVENFYNSTAFSRHFVVDYERGRVCFGDGRHGVMPPPGKFNIKAASYMVGGGESGNVGSRTLRVLPKSIPYIAGCDNPYPAEGGADMESVAMLKSRAAGVFKSLRRAVTAEDFGWLAREASASVGRAECLREKNAAGEIVVVVIPKAPVKSKTDKEAESAARLEPSRELLRQVRSYLDERKVVGTRIRTRGPVYRDFAVEIAVILRGEGLDEDKVRKMVEERLRGYIDALSGGDRGSGWGFGLDLSRGNVMRQLERIEGLFSIEDARLIDLDTRLSCEKLALKEDELPWLSEVRIERMRGAL